MINIDEILARKIPENGYQTILLRGSKLGLYQLANLPSVVALMYRVSPETYTRLAKERGLDEETRLARFALEKRLATLRNRREAKERKLDLRDSLNADLIDLKEEIASLRLEIQELEDEAIRMERNWPPGEQEALSLTQSYLNELLRKENSLESKLANL